MTVFLLLLVLLCIMGAEIKKEKEFFEDYASVEKSNAIKGIFVVLIFFSHARQYMNLTDVYSKYYIDVQTYLHQTIVVPFLFFSGYGIMQSIKKRGMDYVKTIPVRRILKVLLRFAIAISFVCGFNFIYSFTSWKKVIDNNWYVYAILLAYTITFVAFTIFRKNAYIAAACVTIFMIIIVYFFDKTRCRDTYYYNTILVYCLGIWFALLKGLFDKACMKNEFTWLVMIAILGMIYYVAHKNWLQSIWCYEIWACLFMLLILVFSMKISINNGILQFFGKHIFSIYILQRIPMDFINIHYDVVKIPYIFLITSLIATLIIAVIFDYAMDKLDGVILEKMRKTEDWSLL